MPLSSQRRWCHRHTSNTVPKLLLPFSSLPTAPFPPHYSTSIHTNETQHTTNPFIPSKHLLLPDSHNLSFPTSYNSFQNHRRDKAHFIDKTANFKHLFFNKKNQRLFVARPRQFGKSLLMDQLKHVSMGDRAIFGPLQDEHGTVYNPQQFAVYNDEELFHRGNATLHLDFAGLIVSSLYSSFRKLLFHSFELNGIEPPPEFPHWSKWKNSNVATDLITTIQALASSPSSNPRLKAAGERQVDVFIDGHESRIVKLVAGPIRYHSEMEHALKEAKRLYTQLESILSPLETLSPLIDLLFITGVGRFPQTNLYGSVKDLKDVTFDSEYSTLFGYTRAELDEIVVRDVECEFWEELDMRTLFLEDIDGKAVGEGRRERMWWL